MTRSALPGAAMPPGGRRMDRLRSDSPEHERGHGNRVLLASLRNQCKWCTAVWPSSRIVFATASGGESSSAMRIALFQPDIPQNTGTILRLAACLGICAHIIEPAGFPTADRAFRRAGMDYLDQVDITRHESWHAFEEWRALEEARLILFTTQASISYLDHVFEEADILLFGRESSGVPRKVHEAADARLIVPMRPGLRSLNIAMAAAMAVGEAMRQLRPLNA